MIHFQSVRYSAIAVVYTPLPLRAVYLFIHAYIVRTSE